MLITPRWLPYEKERVSSAKSTSSSSWSWHETSRKERAHVYARCAKPAAVKLFKYSHCQTPEQQHIKGKYAKVVCLSKAARERSSPEEREKALVGTFEAVIRSVDVTPRSNYESESRRGLAGKMYIVLSSTTRQNRTGAHLSNIYNVDSHLHKFV